MARLAQVAIGGPVQSVPDSPWGFPDIESRDLAETIFGSLYQYIPKKGVSSKEDAVVSPWNYQYIKNGFEFIVNSFAWPVPGGATFGTARPDPSIGNLQVTDVMMYCDLSRFSKDTDPTTIFNKGYYVSTIDKSDRISEEDYAACGSKPSLKLMDAAITQPAGSGLRYPIIQFCPWYLNMLTHAIPPDVNNPNHNLALQKIVDNNLGNLGAYGWRNIYPLGRQPALAYLNADSWAYFGLAAQQLTQGRRITTSGNISPIRPNVHIDLSGSLPNTVLVDAPAQTLKIRELNLTIPGDIVKAHRGTLERNATGTALISSQTVSTKISLYNRGLGLLTPLVTATQSASAKLSSNAYPTASLGTGSQMSFPFSPSWKNSTRSTIALGTGFSASYKPSYAWPSNLTTFFGSNTVSSSSGLPLLSTFRTSATQLHLSSSFNTKLSSNSVRISSTSGSVQSSSLTSSSFVSATTSLDLPGNFTRSKYTSSATDSSRTSERGYLSGYTLTSTQPGGFVTVIKSSTLVVSTSDVSLSLCIATDEVNRPWCALSTGPAPTATFTIPIPWTGYNPISTQNILSLFTASTFYIPSITNLNSFPTLIVKNPNPKSNDDIKIPFVKVTIPKGPCEPLPKVHHGGLLGAVFNIASDIVDGTLDEACHLVFPILKGVKLPLPGWLTLDIYPSQERFPDNPDDEKSSMTSSSTTSLSSSSSSSCSASAAQTCNISCAVSGTVTQKCTSVCSTITTCSGTATTSSTISSADITETPTAYEHSVPWDYISIQEAIQSELSEALAAASTIMDTSSYVSSLCTTGYSSSLVINGSHTTFNSPFSSRSFPTSPGIISTLAGSTGLRLSSSIPMITPSGASSTDSISASLFSNSSVSSKITIVSSPSFKASASSRITSSSAPITSSISSSPHSKTIRPSTHVASSTTSAVEAVTPTNIFQMGFWHQTDENESSVGNLWFMYVDKLADINMNRVDLCQVKGRVSLQDKNITSTDPLPDPIPYPQGVFYLPTDGAGKGCYYKGDRSAAGIVFCPDKPAVSCQGNVGTAPTICDSFTCIYSMVFCGLEN
ncbi:hypothetical protein EYC84_005008 [Monilinia fructicola]|uniref:Uncharacterized protein n=1 Tax=Monilinia fructicola TaxID=38448 RepID=A0A5M9K0D7_MONFR|nr:hypothetical protein EYC84_005008 [Monilinia fructicola]